MVVISFCCILEKIKKKGNKKKICVFRISQSFIIFTIYYLRLKKPVFSCYMKALHEQHKMEFLNQLALLLQNPFVINFFLFSSVRVYIDFNY